MPRCCPSGILFGVLLLGLLLPAPAWAGDLLGWLAGHARGRSTASAATAPRFAAAPPGPHRYPEYNVYGPWYGYGFGVPSYNWGYFGARYRPAVICHKGYYGDVSQFGYRRGY